MPAGTATTEVHTPRLSERSIYITALVLFVAASALTLTSARMMGGAMPMPGGWSMGMAWTRMPGQSWLGAGAMFTAMWLAMMVAMMLPSSFPVLMLYRRLVAFRGEPHPGALVWLMGLTYFVVWTAFGVAAYAAGVGIAGAAMRFTVVSRFVPAAAGGALVVAGLYQLSPWKFACLKHCRHPLETLSRHLHRGWRGALAIGLHHGLFCTACCWALMLMQLVVGVMNLGAMVVIALVIGLEKLMPRGDLLARAVGLASIGAGLLVIARDALQMVTY